MQSVNLVRILGKQSTATSQRLTAYLAKFSSGEKNKKDEDNVPAVGSLNLAGLKRGTGGLSSFNGVVATVFEMAYQELRASSKENMKMLNRHNEFMRTAVHSILMNRYQLGRHGEGGSGESKGGHYEMTIDYKEDYLLFVIQELQTVGDLQRKINAILGPLLLLNVGLLVIMVCILIFLPIRYFHKLDGYNAMVPFMGNGVTIFVRLVYFVVGLGRVYSKGQEINVALAKAMISSKLNTASQNPVLAYLSVFSANPITFTAWDFFPITRGTLLATFSVISTYAIVFIQSNF